MVSGRKQNLLPSLRSSGAQTDTRTASSFRKLGDEQAGAREYVHAESSAISAASSLPCTFWTQLACGRS